MSEKAKKKKKSKVLEKINRRKVPSASRIKHTVMQLVAVVNDNSQALRSFQNLIQNLNTITRRHVILLTLVQKQLGITDEQIQEETKRLIDESQERAKERSLQSEEARTDEDSSGPEQSNVLDAEVSGGNTDSGETSGVDGDGGSVCEGEPDTSNTVVDASPST